MIRFVEAIIYKSPNFLWVVGSTQLETTLFQLLTSLQYGILYNLEVTVVDFAAPEIGSDVNQNYGIASKSQTEFLSGMFCAEVTVQMGKTSCEQ
ncbi:hypothetical protein CEXT_453871 [Caerostris extrusa]|uniref:Uncharacterized protein n=1 Tax=Caerostris extrusa TaxID=172846 RepID=A0AAV4WQ97_CAEEX|nr:hypothetical protein CEXT_453871 [Caerostris extrusa]